MRYDVEVSWTQAMSHGAPVERWFAHVERPTFTDAFALIERTNGAWWLVVYPRWSIRHRPGLRELRIPYRSARTARKHVDAWVRSNWPRIRHMWGIHTPPVGATKKPP